MSPPRVSLEARILEALGDAPAAQALRWQCFETTLSAEILRDYLGQLPDFEDVEAEDRAHVHNDVLNDVSYSEEPCWARFWVSNGAGDGVKTRSWRSCRKSASAVPR